MRTHWTDDICRNYFLDIGASMEALIAECRELTFSARLIAAKIVFDQIQALLTTAHEEKRAMHEEMLAPHQQEFDTMLERLAEMQPILELELAAAKDDDSSTAAEKSTLAAATVPVEKEACEAAAAAGPSRHDEGDDDGEAEDSTVEGMEGWKLGAEYYGVQTHYKYDDEGTSAASVMPIDTYILSV